MTVTVEDLEVALAKAQAVAAKAEERANAARQASEERRQAAQLAYDEELVAGYDRSTHDAEVTEAEETLRAAVLADPVHAAAVNLYAARLRRHHAFDTATSAAGRLGRMNDQGVWVEGPRAPQYPDPVTAEAVDAIVTREGSRLAADEQDAVDQQRIDGGATAAAG